MRSWSDKHDARRSLAGSRRLRLLVALAAAVIGFTLSTGVAMAAAPGSLDSGFGSAGVASLGSGTQLLGVAVQPDGQVVAAGQSGGHVFVERLDASGHAAGSYTGAAGYARAVALQSNGDVVIAGSSNGAMFAERLTPALTPDPSFGSGGVASAFAGQSGVAYGVAVGSDGTVVAAGSVNPVDTRVGVAKFNAAGATQFTQVVDFGAYSVARGVAVQPDGKIVLVGSQTPLQLTNAVIARLTTAGALDTTFAGGRGAFTYSQPNSGYTAMNAVALQSNGDIVAAGSTAAGPTEVTLRVTPAGALDPSFGNGGVATLPAGQNVNVSAYPIGAYGVGLAAAGTIVAVGGYENTGTEVDHALWAFGSGGAAVGSFGAGGVVRAPEGAYEGCAIAIAADGSLVTAGNSVTSFPDTSPCSSSAGASGFVARYVGFGAVGAVPVATTGGASAVTASGAKLSGQVNPNGEATTYQFQYGKATTYGSSTRSASAGSGTTAQTEFATLSKLARATTYHYRLVATNARGTNYGVDRTFRTTAHLTVSLNGLHGSYKKTSASRSGVRFRVRCSEGCSIKASLVASASIARRLHVRTTVKRCTKVKGKRRCTTKREYAAVSVASASAKLSKAGTSTLTIKRGRLAAALRTSKNVRLTLNVVVTAGSQKKTVKRTLNFHP